MEEAIQEVEQEIPVETEEVSEVETEEATASTEEPTEVQEVQEEPRKKNVQQRINELTRARYDEKRRADELERRLHEMYKPTSVPTSESPPKEDDFDTYEQYIAAQARYEARQEYNQLRKQEKEQEEQAKKEQSERSFQERLTRQAQLGNTKFEDFYEVTSNFNVSRDVVAATLESDIGDEIIYYLATHPEETARIQSMTLHGQALEIGRLETKLKTPTKKTTSAPDPITPVSTSGVDTRVDLYSDNTDDAAWGKEFRKKRQQMRGL